MKSESVISERGQVTLPKRLRERLGLAPGTRVVFEPSASGLLVRKTAGGSGPLREVYGTLKDGIKTDAYLRRLRGKVE